MEGRDRRRPFGHRNSTFAAEPGKDALCLDLLLLPVVWDDGGVTERKMSRVVGVEIEEVLEMRWLATLLCRGDQPPDRLFLQLSDSKGTIRQAKIPSLQELVDYLTKVGNIEKSAW